MHDGVLCAGCCAILVVEDEDTLRLPLHDFLVGTGARVVSVDDGAQAIAELQRRDYDLVFTDLRLPGADGYAVMTRAHEAASKPAVVMMTAYADVESAVRALREGAYDYLAKPFLFAQVEAILRRHCQQRQVVRERDELRQELDRQRDPTEIVACSRTMQAVLDTVRKVAPTDASVILLGETGTGKELVVEALHRLSPRRAGRLVKLNCAAVPESLFESELFGHERGAFTGAVARKRGRFEMADKGTLFLDEIADLSPSGQVKLLRAVQERQFERVGGLESIRVDARFVAASHKDLRELVRLGQFREDLYYRLAVITIEMPPLRDRLADLPLLVEQLLQRAARHTRRPVPAVAPEVLDRLRHYHFAGNVRELANLVERAATLCDGMVIEPRHFPAEVMAGVYASESTTQPGDAFLPLQEATARFEKAHIDEALARTGGRRAEAARLLGIARKTLWARLQGGAADDDTEDPVVDHGNALP